MTLEKRPFGRTGLSVSALGLGAGPLGAHHLSEDAAERLIHAALDLGITLIDTARSYGASEARIGRALSGRRARVTISTKVGYGIAGVADWTPEAVQRGIDEALVKLRTDWIDIVHLHSCSTEPMHDVAGALADAARAGKIRVAAYAGENDALDAAVASGYFGAIQLSLNPWDQGAIDRVLGTAKANGMGAIAKRPLANAWWTHPARPDRSDLAEYWDRGHRLTLADFGLAPEALALRFAAFTWGIDSAIAGTTRLAHLETLVRHIQDGPLPEAVAHAVRAAWHRAGASWPGLV